ncbi:peptide synthetase [Lentinus tigrinus ALCF2SS1-7]|uniref:Peptide synthetase n=1 Tax=Lentinus tigrinus ALCF2SS1-6 TaxID=1328759 RepID=A0A5C2SRU5_9APHY|nr:peptide synthetase [Lentinus tigrinus ALCF2SS1-6]RPD80086.1 peptide synthetase [Lentinus tigrinus ALCF2SS1-7]
MSPASPTVPEPAPTAGAPVRRADLEQILAGYRHQDFPDLSSRRFAPDTTQSVSLSLPQNVPTPLSRVVAAIGRVLGAYCACPDVLICLADGEGEGVLPVRVTWTDGQSWEDASKAVAEALADPSWPRVQPDALRRALDLTPKQSPALALVSAGALPSPNLLGQFPLVVRFEEDEAKLGVTISERICHPSQCKLFLSQVVALDEHASADPTSPLASLPHLPINLTSSYEKHDSQERCERYYLVPPTTYATDHLTLRAIENPDAVAVRWYADLSTDVPITNYTPDTITNAELEHRANQFGRWLLSIGLEKGRSVAICMKRDILFHIAFIGTLRAGGCYVPIDAELPLERQHFIARDSNAQFILSTSDIPCFSSLGDIAIDVQEPATQKAIDEQSSEALMVPLLEDDAYILYTSGTTGTPKGCILTHRGLTEAVWALSQFCASAEIAPAGRVNYLSVASVAFDVHIAEIMIPLAVGIPILAAPRSLLLEDLPYYIKNLRISHVGIVPSLIEATMSAVQEEEDEGQGIVLRYLASGGEKMSDAILDRWADHPKVKLANFYGPSEVTIGCAARMMDKDTPRANIGHTFANVAAYIVDENMDIVLRGAPGELVVEGPLVGRGYVGRPDLTEKSFLKFPDDGTDRWAYRTGDLVRMTHDATLEIMGRIDTQIKLRGVRIESEGISSILRSAAAPAYTLDVITVLAKHPAIGVEQLVSFVAWDSSVPVSTRKGGKPCLASPPDGLLQKLRSASERELASYMRPSHIVPLNFIPLSSNGKADAKVLTAFFLELDMTALTGLMAGSKSAASSKEPRREPTDLERKVLGVLEPYVKIPVERLGPETNLFECGVDSLAVARFAADLRRTFEVKVSPPRIMQAPLVSAIAAIVEGGQTAAVAGEQSSTVQQFADRVRGEVEGAYSVDTIEALLPPLPVQEGVLFRSVNAPTMYVQHVLLRLGPEVSVEKLRGAWRELVALHEMLRTVFHFGSELVQVILRSGTYDAQTSEKEIDDCDEAGFQRYFTEQEAASISRELNVGVSKVPPVRLSVFHTRDSANTYIALSIHHALYDGISLPVLLQDLERLYEQRPQLPSAPLRSILDHLGTVDSRSAEAFWSSYLKDYPWQRLLNRTASSRTAEVTSRTFSMTLSELQAKAAGRHVTVQALLMCAYASLLAKDLYGNDDVVFGVIRAGRTIPVDSIETTICPMITVVPARVRLNEPAKALQAVQDDIARVSEFEHVPLSRIQKWVAHRDGSLFDTLFSVSYKEHGSSELWSVLDSQNPEPDYILAIEVVLDPEQDRAMVHAAFTSSDVSPSVVDDILGQLEETAVHIAQSSDWGWDLVGGGRSLSVPSPAPDADAPSESAEDLSDVDEATVSSIRTIAAQFLHIDLDFVKNDTSLLSLGLDSIKSVGLSRKLTAAGLGLSSADIMRLSTPLRLAAYIQKAKSTGGQKDNHLSDAEFAAECQELEKALDTEAIKFSSEDAVKFYPTTVLQAGMLSQTISSHGRLYVHLFPLRLAHGVDVGRLREAWRKAISMFDMLRTSFHFVPSLGVWAQVIHSSPSIQWSESDYDPATNLVEALNPFTDVSDEENLFRCPPIFLHLLKSAVPGDGHRLVLVLHHALYDGLAIAKLFDAVQQLYHAIDLQTTNQYHQLLPRLLWQERNGTSFWVRTLRDLRSAPVPRTASENPVVHQVSLPVHLTEEEIRQVCRGAEVTPQCIGQTAFAKLLAVLTQRRDVVFGRVVSGRDVPGAEEVIGPMLNTVPCRVRFYGDASNRELLKRLHNANIASMPWQHASLRSIQRELGLSNLWDSLFVYQPKQESLESKQDALWVFEGDDVEDISVQYPLNIELHETGFVVEAACMSSIAGAAEFRQLVDQYAAFLCDIVRRPDSTWYTGLPDIPEHTPSEGNGHIPEEPEAVDSALDSRFDKFREILATTTKVEPSKIHPHSHLAALGIDSITAVQIVAKSRRVGLRLTAADVVQSRTVSDVLKKARDVSLPATNGYASANGNGHAAAPVVELPRKVWTSLVQPHVVDEVERVTHASAGMEWLIGMWQRSGGSRFQHVFGYRLAKGVNASKLQDAWYRLLRRHAVLRSTFVYDPTSGTPKLVIFKPDALSLSWRNEELDSSTDPLNAVQKRMKDLVSQPPSIDRPISRALFLHSPEAEYLLIHLHHFQYDAWSLQLLLDDLMRLYKGEDPQSSNDLDSFIRFALPGPDGERVQKQYWKAAFSEKPAPFPRLCHKASTGRDVYTDTAAISGAEKLDQRSRELAVSLQSIFLACWARVQSNHAGRGAPTFSLWHSGRTGDVHDVERLACPCINVLPFSIPDAQGENILALAKQIQDVLQARSAVVEQSRLVKVHEWVGRHEPLSNVFINIVKIAPELEKSTNVLLEPLGIPYYIPDVPAGATSTIGQMRVTDLLQDDIMVDIAVVQETDKVVMSIEYSQTVLHQRHAKQILEEWAALVKDALGESKRDALHCTCM